MDAFLTIDELAAALKVPKSWVYARTGEVCDPAKRIPHLKFGRHIRFDPAEVEEWFKTRHRNGHEPSGPRPEGGS